MNRMTRLAWALLTSFALTACFDDGGGGGDNQSPGHQTTGESWTVLVYMVADNDLEPFALQDLAEMAQVGRNGSFRFVVQADRSAAYTSDPIGNLPDWTTTKRLLVEQNGFTELQDLGEVNMGEPSTLADFIQWGVKNHPADRYALIFWDHGAAWPGFGGDGSTNDFDLLSISELKNGIQSGLQAAGLKHLAMIGFDACLMANYEVATALAPYGEYLLASEELEPGHGWDYRSFASTAANPTNDPIALGRAVIDGFLVQAQQANTAARVTLSLVDLFALDTLKTGVETLAAEGQKNLETGAVKIARGLDEALGFNRAPDPTQSSHMVDLGDLAAKLAQGDGRFATAKQQIDAGLQKAVVYRTHGPTTTAATGLAIYFPPYVSLYRTDYAQLTEVAAWRTFLNTFHGGAPGAVAPTFTNPNKLAAIEVSNGTLHLQGSLASGAAAQIATAELLYGIRDVDTGSVYILGDYPASWDDSKVLGTWDLSVLTLTQGNAIAFSYMSIQLIGNGNFAAILPFSLVQAGSSEELYAIRQLIFDGNGQLVQDQYYVITDAGVGELYPTPGSTITPLLQEMDSNGYLQWAYGGDPMDPTQEISLGFNYVQSGGQVFGALVIKDSAEQGDSVANITEVQ